MDDVGYNSLNSDQYGPRSETVKMCVIHIKHKSLSLHEIGYPPTRARLMKTLISDQYFQWQLS